MIQTLQKLIKNTQRIMERREFVEMKDHGNRSDDYAYLQQLWNRY
jgi:hypothetical protein